MSASVSTPEPYVIRLRCQLRVVKGDAGDLTFDLGFSSALRQRACW